MRNEFREGDRVEWVGVPLDTAGSWPQRGERGWLVQIDPHDDIVVWDYCGTLAGDFTRYPMVRVGERNEPNPAKRLPHDPYGRDGDD